MSIVGPRGQRRVRWLLPALSVALLAVGLVAVAPPSSDEAAAAFNRPVRVMLVGDSITSGQKARPGQWPTYRGALWEKLTGFDLGGPMGDEYSKSVNFVGHQVGIGNPPDRCAPGDNVAPCQYNQLINGPGTPFPLKDPHHEGHDGWTINQLTAKLPDWTSQHNPDVVVLFAGANDLAPGGDNDSPTKAAADLVNAVKAVQQAKPNARIVVAELPPHRDDSARTEKNRQFNSLLPNVIAQTTATSPVVIAPLFDGYCALTHPDDEWNTSNAAGSCFNIQYNNDGSHPDEDGHIFIARQIGDVVQRSGFLEDPIPAPRVNSVQEPPLVRGDVGVSVTVTGVNPTPSNIPAFLPNASFEFGEGIDVASATWVNPRRYDLVIDVSRFAAPGNRTMVMTNPDGKTSTFANAVRITTAAPRDPKLRVMVLGDIVPAGNPTDNDTHPTFRHQLARDIPKETYNLTAGTWAPPSAADAQASVEVEFVGTQSGIGTGASSVPSVFPLTDPDHEAHVSFKLEDFAKFGPGSRIEGPLPTWLESYDPDVVVINAGFNDLFTINPMGVPSNSDLNILFAKFRPVLESIFAQNPFARVLVTDLTPHKNNATRNAQIDAFNNAINSKLGSVIAAVESKYALPAGQVLYRPGDIRIETLSDLGLTGADIETGGPSALHLNNLNGAMLKVATEIRIKTARQGKFWVLLGTQRPAPPAAAPTVTSASGRATVKFKDSPWNYDAGPINRYVVTATPKNGGAAKTANLNLPGAGYNPANTAPTTRTVVMTGLTAGVQYEFRVQAVSARGTGQRSLSTTATVQAAGGGQSPAPPPGSGGYFVLEQDGELYAFGDARALLKSMDGSARQDPGRGATISSTLQGQLGGAFAIAMETTENEKGLWVLASDGRILTLGNAPAMPGVSSTTMTKVVAGQPEQVAAMARLGNGALWVFTSAGRVIPQSGGALPPAVEKEMNVVLGLDLLGPVIDAKPTADGEGVLALASDGGVFTYNAQEEFLGSVWNAISEALQVPLGSVGPDRPVVGITMDPDGDGYWISAEDGGVFAMRGRAPFRGSLPAIIPFDQLLAPIGGMVPFGNGYLLVGRDGGVFNFSNKPFSGSASGLINTQAVALASV